MPLTFMPVDDREHAPPLPSFGDESVVVHSLWWYVCLWLLLACVTATVLAFREIPSAVYEPRVSIAVGSVSGVVGLALLQLGVLRFRALRRGIDLYTGMAFGALAIANLYRAWVPIVTGASISLDVSALSIMLMRAFACAIFLWGLLSTTAVRSGSYPLAWSAFLSRAGAAMLAAVLAAILISELQHLSPLLHPSTRELLANGQPIDDMLPGQEPLLVFANAVLSLALLVSTVGYTAEAHRLRDPHIGALAVVLMFLFFGELNRVFVPALPVQYVSAGDIVCLSGYLLLLCNLMWRTAKEFAASALRNERMRLSRELHDGLAQQLAILHLRLGRLAEATAPSDPRAHDLAVAQRVLETAAVEARGAIAALRSERIRWDNFADWLLTVSNEFSTRYDMEARVSVEPSELEIDTQLQVDVLRILQEAFSNAARHGRAKCIEATAVPEGTILHVTIRDDGTGFDAAHVRGGVGLRSMIERAQRRNGTFVIQSSPGYGTEIQLRLPVGAS